MNMYFGKTGLKTVLLERTTVVQMAEDTALMADLRADRFDHQWKNQPLLFSIFTNNLPFILERATIALYTDGSTIDLSDPDLGELNKALNEELKQTANG